MKKILLLTLAAVALASSVYVLNQKFIDKQTIDSLKQQKPIADKKAWKTKSSLSKTIRCGKDHGDATAMDGASLTEEYRFESHAQAQTVFQKALNKSTKKGWNIFNQNSTSFEARKSRPKNDDIFLFIQQTDKQIIQTVEEQQQACL